MNVKIKLVIINVIRVSGESMNKIVTYTLTVLLLLLSGCFINKQSYDNETIQKAMETAESYLRNNY